MGGSYRQLLIKTRGELARERIGFRLRQAGDTSQPLTLRENKDCLRAIFADEATETGHKFRILQFLANVPQQDGRFGGRSGSGEESLKLFFAFSVNSQIARRQILFVEKVAGYHRGADAVL